ncbi:hypothetical protein [Micromonospora zamorensis]|uniref:Excreted virulence factor EspC, type VII ESX diderm n=1 Tax=Micromonospora zamorensis TaxID=709883 RepID=A0ABZ1P9J1_9ACTN
MPQMNFTKLAEGYLERAFEMAKDSPNPDAEQYLRFGQALAVLAVAQELSKLREAVNGVEDALEDQNGHGIGTYLKHASEYLEKIAQQ